MPQTIKGRVVKIHNIVVGQISGVENMTLGQPPPAPPNENVNLVAGTCPYGVENIRPTVPGPNPEIV